MSISPLSVAAEEFVFGDSSCRPPGDGQENGCPASEYVSYKQQHSARGLDLGPGLSSSYKENTSWKHQVPVKMKGREQSERVQEQEPSKHAQSLSYLRWARDLHELLDDPKGLELFTHFLDSENFSFHSLGFWLAINGLKNNMNIMCDPLQLGKAIVVIYKKYIKGSVVSLNPQTKKEITSKVNTRRELNVQIFDKACAEIEDTELRVLYMNFLKSDLYLQYVQKMQNGSATGDSCRQSESSGSNSSTGSRDMLDIMPTVPEESELRMDYNSCTPVLSVPTDTYRHRLSSRSQDALRFSSNNRNSNNTPYMSLSKTRYSNSPYAKYSSYLPPSAQDSDRQSLSSDAHTDDAMSMSDLDIVPFHLSKSRSSHERSMRKCAHLNNENNELHPVIPRTHRVQVESYTEATTSPQTFAAKLIGKLLEIKQEWKKHEETSEKLQDTLKRLDLEDESYSSNSLKRFEGIPQQLLKATIQEKLVPTIENTQSILDEHCSRVWDDSLHQSPINLTPGQYSPPIRTRSPLPVDRMKLHFGPPMSHGSYSLGARHKGYEGHNNQPQPQSMSRNPAYTHHRHRKERDTCSTDSGTVQDFAPNKDMLNYSDHHHRHHHIVDNATEQPLPSSSGYRRSRDGSSSSRRASQKKSAMGDSGSSCVDSGVGLCDPVHPAVRDKVSSWLANEEYMFSYCPNVEKDSSSHQKKSSHSSLSNSSGNQSKQSKKQAAGYGLSNRSVGMDHSGPSWGNQQSNIVQQQGMMSQQQQQVCGYGLSGPPAYDVTAQLVEAKKRLEEETRYKQQLSGSRSKSGSSSKDKNQHLELMHGRSLSNKVPEMSEEKQSLRKMNKRASNIGASSSDRMPAVSSSIPSAASSTTGSSSATGELTTVCYCFSGEQIPYLTKLPGKNITFKQFKTIITKRGNFRFYFKTINDEFGPATVVQEEVMDDNAFVPLWEGKISCTIESIPDP